MTALNSQAKYPRTNASKRNNLTFSEDLADVVIEVYPSATSISSGPDHPSERHCTEPAAKIPAHVAILAGKNEYFKALFSNGMAETLEPSQALRTVNTSAGQNIIAERSRKMINIRGYSAEAVRYFIAYLYDDGKTVGVGWFGSEFV
ncbi:hypothetical protein DFS34DRAFT_690556 [Phlyctochytrium arcticum]|nr:hypothetical protein DFS34DRAFT_690556 [Phlyctochytrium arcticum]